MGQMNFSLEASKPDNPATNRSKLYPKAGGWYRLDSAGNEVKLADLSDFNVDDVELGGNVYVSMDGVDVSANGSLSKPFRTIGAAITYINANYTPSATENYCIMVSAGEYSEGTLVLPRFVALWGTHYRTRIIANSTSINLITSQGAHTIRDVILSGVTNPSNYLIKADASASTRLLIQNVGFLSYEVSGSISNGVYASASSGELHVEFKSIDFGDITGNCIELNSNSRAIVRSAQIFECPLGTFLKSSNNCSYSINDVDLDSLGTAVNHLSTGDSDVSNCNFIEADVPFAKSVACNILVQNTSIVSAKSAITNFEGITGQFYDQVEGENTIRILEELSVGLPEFGGKESAFGEGDSYTLGMKVFTYDGTTYTDVSEAATSASGSTFSLPTSGTTREIYISTLRSLISTSDFLQFQGIKTYMNTPASSDGEFVSEYWNGTSWVEFNTMSSEGSGNYYPFAKLLFERSGSEQIKFTKLISGDWAKSNAVGLGFSTYWMRFRAVTVPTTLPVFEKIKIHSNRTEINADGYIEYFGDARPILSFDISGFQAANNSPANQDLYFQSNFGIGYIENLFVDGAVDQVSKAFYLPSSICTACPLRLRVILISKGTDTNLSDWTLRWIINKEGDPFYTSGAPTSNPNVQSMNVSISPTGINKQFTLEALLDVSDYIADSAAGKPDIVGLSIMRNGNTDDNSDDIAMAAASIFYSKSNEGSHV